MLPVKTDAESYVDDQNKPFYANGVLINAPLLHPEKKILVIQKADATHPRSTVAIDSWQDFSPLLHERMPVHPTIEGVIVEKPAQIEAPVVAEPEAVIIKDQPESPLSKSLEERARFNHLKERGWKELKGEERTEYQSLKKIYGDPKDTGSEE